MATSSTPQPSSTGESPQWHDSNTPGEECEEGLRDDYSEDGPHYAPIGGTRKRPARKQSENEDYFSMYPDALENIRTIASRTQTFTSARSRANSLADGSQIQRLDTLAGVNLGDPVLDPTKPEFDMYKWARMFVKLAKEEGMSIRQAGFTFKNLNVSGSGNALQLQQDVTDPLMLPFRLGEYFSFNKESERKILRDFEGTVGPGEMLIVLGRPGSGCSTFLKTICGETHGLKLAEGSDISYSGMYARP